MHLGDQWEMAGVLGLLQLHEDLEEAPGFWLHPGSVLDLGPSGEKTSMSQFCLSLSSSTLKEKETFNASFYRIRYAK